MARFGQALKPSKVPQQLSKASAPHNPPLALPSYLPISPSNCFYWASKLLHGTCIFVCPTRSPVARRQGCIFSLNLCSMLLGSEATGKRTGNQSLNPEHLYFDIYIYIYIVFCLVYPPNEMDFTVPVVLLFTWRARTTSQIEEQL